MSALPPQHQLSKGCVKRLYSGLKEAGAIVQVLSMKQLQKTDAIPGPQRWRIAISDGENQIPATLAIQLGALIENGTIRMFSIIKIAECVVNSINSQATKLIVILKLEVISQANAMIGNPVKCDAPSQTAPAANPAPSSNGNFPNSNAHAPPRMGTTTNNQSHVGSSTTSNAFGNNPARPAAQPRGDVMKAPPPPPPPPQQQFAGSRPNTYNNNNSNTGNGGGYQRRPAEAAPVTNQSDLPPIQPIATLNPYQTRWCIKARVTRKGQMREWTNQKGTGKLMHVDLVDAEGGEIGATMFNRAAEKWFPLFDEGRIFLISRGSIKPANKRFTTIPHEYELSLDENAVVFPVDEDNTIPSYKFNLVKILELAQGEIQADMTVDVLGVVTSIGPISEVTIKSRATTTQKRVLVLVDDSNVGVELALWDKHVSRTDIALGDVLAAKHVRVSTFNGVSLSAVGLSLLSVNPPLADAEQLRSWYAQQTEQFGCVRAEIISRPDPNRAAASGGSSAKRFIRKTLAQLKDPRLALNSAVSATNENGNGANFWVKGFVTFIRTPQEGQTGSIWYPACPNEDCKKKKVVDNHNGTWICEKCAGTFNEVEFRYVLPLQICDHTGSQWCTAFNDQGAFIMDINANELNQQREENPGSAMEDAVDSALFKQYLFKIRVRSEQVHDEERLRCVIMDARKIDAVKQCNSVLRDIRDYHNHGCFGVSV